MFLFRNAIDLFQFNLLGRRLRLHHVFHADACCRQLKYLRPHMRSCTGGGCRTNHLRLIHFLLRWWQLLEQWLHLIERRRWTPIQRDKQPDEINENLISNKRDRLPIKLLRLGFILSHCDKNKSHKTRQAAKRFVDDIYLLPSQKRHQENVTWFISILIRNLLAFFFSCFTCEELWCRQNDVK